MDPTPSAMDSRTRLHGRSHRAKNRTEVHMPGWGAARARARVMARVGLGVWPRWLGFTMADPTPLCNGEKAYFTRLWVPLTERSQLSTTTRKKLLLCIISTRLTM